MVIGLLAVTAIPTVIGVGQAVSAQKRQNEKSKEQVKFKLTADTLGEDVFCVLVDGQLFVNHPAAPAPGYAFNGYYFTYPSEDKHLGLVSLISDEPPMLNWIYADRDSGAVRYGGRANTLGNHIGPWGWSSDEEYLTYNGVSVFLAVEAPPAEGSDGNSIRRWAIHLHPQASGVDSALVKGRKGVQTKLRRHRALGIKSQYLKRDE